MPDPNDKDQNNGGSGSGDGNPPAPPTKTVEERLAEMESEQKKTAASFQTAQEELKRVNGLNAVLMQRLQGGGTPPPAGGEGMDVNRTVPLKLKRDFSSMDPTADPGRFAQELILETAEQVAVAMARNNEQQQNAQSLRKAFYEKNKDLVGWERLVGSFSEEVQRENPSQPFDQASEEIARRTREFVKSRGSGNEGDEGNPQHILPPGSQGDGVHIKPPKGGASEPYNPDKAYNDDMASYAKERNAERNKLATSPKT